MFVLFGPFDLQYVAQKMAELGVMRRAGFEFAIFVFEGSLTIILGTCLGTVMQYYHRLHIPVVYRGLIAHVTLLNRVRNKWRSIGEMSVPL
jgi:hypothetical protein